MRKRRKKIKHLLKDVDDKMKTYSCRPYELHIRKREEIMNMGISIKSVKYNGILD
jgi:hypothetical protein